MSPKGPQHRRCPVHLWTDNRAGVVWQPPRASRQTGAGAAEEAGQRTREKDSPRERARESHQSHHVIYHGLEHRGAEGHLRDEYAGATQVNGPVFGRRRDQPAAAPLCTPTGIRAEGRPSAASCSTHRLSCEALLPPTPAGVSPALSLGSDPVCMHLCSRCFPKPPTGEGL